VRRGALHGLVVALALGSTPGPARAESVTLGVDPAAAGDRNLTVRSADVRGHQRLRAAVALDYARDPLVLTNAEQDYDHVVTEQLRLHALGSYALSHRYLLTLDLPFTVLEDGEPTPGLPEAGAALGDVRVSGRARLLGPAGNGFHGSVELALWVPTGAAESFSSDGAVRFGPSLIVGAVQDRFTWAVESGIQTRPSQRLPGVLPTRVGTAWVSGAAAKWSIDHAGQTSVGPEVTASFVLADGARLLDPRSSAVQFSIAGLWRIGGGPWYAALGGGPGVGRGAGAADYRVLLSCGWSVEAEPPPPDRDDDTVADAIDACPELAGSRSSDPVMNGCPELPDDTDGDAVLDRFDACPREPGEPSPERARHGCPKPVSKPAPAEPPPPPPPPPAKLEAEQITISEQVQFETGTAVLRPESEPLLRAVAEILSGHPELELIEVQGHTDDTGPADLNRRLAQDRAESVVRWLVEHRIEAARLSARGYGPDRPIASNEAEDGRARNRRVEFHIQRRSGGAAP
jgi:outer membrane protein OmpA-like peptidoglycan-associated protein